MNSEQCLATIGPESDNEGFDSGQTRKVSCSVFHQLAVLAIGEVTIGVHKAELIEVAPLSVLLPYRHEPEWLIGMTLVGNDWVPLISLQNWPDLAPSSKIALLACKEGYRLGLLIDTVIGYRDVYQAEIVEQPLPTLHSQWQPVHAITHDNLQLIDVPRIFAHPAMAPEAMRNYYMSR